MLHRMAECLTVGRAAPCLPVQEGGSTAFSRSG
jgi:hypothetical protein